MPKQVKITDRVSSITNSFISGIIPVVHPSDDEIQEALCILGMIKSGVRCAYCYGISTEWDHLRPLVQSKRPTGYISEISNLVPACGKCNQSKGNKYWRDWMFSKAPLSPKTRKVPHLDVRASHLEKYEKWKQVDPMDFERIVGEGVWDEHWKNYDKVVEEMKQSQLLAETIRIDLKKHYNKNYR